MCVDEPQREGDPGIIGTPGVCAWKWNIVKEKEEIKSDGRRKILYTNQYELTL